jgi:hypothetical protein
MDSIAIGKHIKWTLKSPSETGYVADEFYDFIRDNNEEFIITENSYIEGTVIYSSFGSAVVEISDMTPEMFPFTLFCNEVKNRFPDIDIDNSNLYQRYLCLDIETMTSLYYYDIITGEIIDAEYDEEDGFFLDYPPKEDMETGTLKSENETEQVFLQLDKVEIESLMDNGSFQETEEILEVGKVGADKIPGMFSYCSVPRAKTWFNTRDCAILSAWRQGKNRKTNDSNNKELQLQLRRLGYGVTKITGWYKEKDKEMSRENSFLTVNLNDESSFREDIFKLSERYEQDCFLYKKAGYDTPAVYVYTNDAYGKKGSEKIIGRLRIGNMEAEAFSQIKSGRITFE